MKYVKISIVVILGLIVLAFVSFKDYEVNGDPNWPKNIKIYSNPITNRIRVVDSDDETTLFYYSVDAFAKPIRFQKEDNKWIITFEKR